MSLQASFLSSFVRDSPHSPSFRPMMIAVADPIAIKATLNTLPSVCAILSADTTERPRTL